MEGNSNTPVKEFCVQYRLDKSDFLADVIAEYRRQEFTEIITRIRKKLRALTPGNVFNGWIILFEPLSKGKRGLPPLLTEELAAEKKEDCEAILRDAVRYAHTMALYMKIDPVEEGRLAFEVDNFPGWPRDAVGTILQSLLAKQENYVVQVVPKFTSGRGGFRCIEGLSEAQLLQLGMDNPEYYDHVYKQEGFGLGGDDDLVDDDGME